MPGCSPPPAGPRTSSRYTSDQPFYAKDNIATADGRLASHYLAAWTIARLEGNDAAESALHYVARPSLLPNRATGSTERPDGHCRDSRRRPS
ncbi:hypothetical protein [Streptomyces sp. NPDC056165]|uniref:hypothetical protein n=1 Tax=Streptomyces sp. NPDC056165 TaxID=3345733 RepID=UPI0035DEA128